MALAITKEQYQTLEAYFNQVYNQATEAQQAVRALLVSLDGTAKVEGFELTQVQLDARELKLKNDWANIKSKLIAEIDGILGV